MTNQPMSNESLVKSYIDLRNREKEIKDRHKDELAPLTQTRETIEAVLAARLADADASSIKTQAGTFYKAVTSRVQVVDWHAALEWIVANDRMDMLVRSVAKEPYLEVTEDGTQVPGLVVNQTAKVNIRKS